MIIGLREHQLGQADAPVIRHGIEMPSGPGITETWRRKRFQSDAGRGSMLGGATGRGEGGEFTGRSASFAAHFDFMLFGNFGPF